MERIPHCQLQVNCRHVPPKLRILNDLQDPTVTAAVPSCHVRYRRGFYFGFKLFDQLLDIGEEELGDVDLREIEVDDQIPAGFQVLSSGDLSLDYDG